MGMLMSTVLKDVVLFILLMGELLSIPLSRIKEFHRIGNLIPISSLQEQLLVQTA